DILMSKERKMCLCTAMLYDPAKEVKSKKFEGFSILKDKKIFERWMSLKNWVLLRSRGDKKP
ncbi:hypothetical protein RZS08_35270, partial [Arthrospira platensis SPKY1]|nr:hypothetical protein [Arthrospira platensis SPKY1]